MEYLKTIVTQYPKSSYKLSTVQSTIWQLFPIVSIKEFFNLYPHSFDHKK